MGELRRRRADADSAQRLRTEIASVVEAHAARADYGTPVPGLRVARLTAPLPPTTHLAGASICLCIRGSRTLMVGDSTFEHDEDRFLLSAIELPTVIAIPDASPRNPHIAVRVDIDIDVARQVMSEIDLHGAETARSSPLLLLGMIDVDLLESLARMVRLIERPKDVSFLSDLVHRELLYHLLSGPTGARLRHIVRAGSQGDRAAKAIAWLRRHYRDRLRIEQLARVAGMGISTLHRHFRELTTMSPIQYQKQLRLHEARRRMLEDRVEVATAAFDVGYESPTQFIREYRRLFGAPPLRNVNAIRTTGGARTAI